MSVSPSSPVSRRTVVKVGSGGALALLLGGGAGWLDRRTTDETDLTASTDALTPSTSSTTSTTTTAPPAPVTVEGVGEIDPAILTLGERVVATTGDTDAAALLALLPAGDPDPVTRAATRVRDDFRAGDTITVDGWVLAASEARAAAVLFLVCEGGC